jgi:hypothetical protein
MSCFVLCSVFFLFYLTTESLSHPLNIVGFYHIYFPVLTNEAATLIKGQFDLIIESHVFQNTTAFHFSLIGESKQTSPLRKLITTILEEKEKEDLSFLLVDEGFEQQTISQLWKFCQSHPEDIVWYLHNKGSYHRRKNNDILREWLTKLVLSEGCLKELKKGADACGMRFADVPHRHFPGNMWIAKCSYIRLLPDPLKAMRGESCRRIQPSGRLRIKNFTTPCVRESCLALGRYYIEHWIGILGDGIMTDCLGVGMSMFFSGYSFVMEIPSYPRECQLAPRAIAREFYYNHTTHYERLLETYCAQVNKIVDKILYGTKMSNGKPLAEYVQARLIPRYPL